MVGIEMGQHDVAHVFRVEPEPLDLPDRRLSLIEVRADEVA
ncbi:hypothetical protein [Streptomyces sp. SA15]|nr:hypothetical protein [Streptomyces sp. SA15]